MPLDDLPDHGETDARTVVLVPGMEPLEDDEDPVEVFGIDPDPVVRDGELDGPFASFG